MSEYPLIAELEECLRIARSDPRLTAHERAERCGKEKMFAVVAEAFKSGDKDNVAAAISGAAFVLAFFILDAGNDPERELQWFVRIRRRLDVELSLIKSLVAFRQTGEVDEQFEGDSETAAGA